MTAVPPLAAPRAPIDLSRPLRLHVVGVGGPGMSAIAIALAEMGHTVSGSDFRDQPVLDRVRAAGVVVSVGHDADVVVGCDAVTSSTAIPAHNIELAAARELGIPTLRRAGMLAAICAQARSIGVAGTHGKTTTTSMLMLILAAAGTSPSFIVGGDVMDAGTGAHWAGSDVLVVEADESDGTHLELPLAGTILLNVDLDFLQHYGTFEALRQSFDTYVAQIDGPKVLCADDPVCAELAARHGATTYGLAATAEVRAVDLRSHDGSFSFAVERRRADGAGRRLGEPSESSSERTTRLGEPSESSSERTTRLGEPSESSSERTTRLGSIELPLRGVHNVVNATAAIAMALELGATFEDCRAALARFGGVARRFDIRGVDAGATFVDDYGHLPAEIAAVIAAARDSGDGWRRVIVAFQPNRFNRIAEMWHDYADAFVGADVVVITDIYPSGTTPIPGVSGKLIVNAVVDAHPRARVVWLPRRDDVVSFVAGEVGPGDVCISMGCGDIAGLPEEVLARRAARRTG